MKMVKKILLGLTASALIMGMVSCKMGEGEGETDGNKWDLTMTIDTTDPKKPMAANTQYRRFWEQISASEKVAGIKTTITIDPSKCTYTDNTALVAGLIFDLNKGTDANTVDFNLIGINPKRNSGAPQYYVERYEGVSNEKKKSGDTNDGSIGSAVNPLPKMDWENCTSSMYYTDADGILTFIVTIKQTTPKTYEIYLGNVKVKECTINRTTNVWKDKNNVEYLSGGIACYGNASSGNKIVANYKSDKNSVLGKLEAEEIEE